jgi:hypothetical protein
MVKLLFWFQEFKIVVSLLGGEREGLTPEQIRDRNNAENLLGAASPLRSRQICGTVLRRIDALVATSHDAQGWFHTFGSVDVASQKIVNLIAIMCLDRLFFEYVHEVYAPAVASGCRAIEKSDCMRFFRDKQAQNEQIASWKDQTFIKLGQSYHGCLAGAGLVSKGRTEKVILDADLEKRIRESDMGIYKDAITGGAY